MKINDYSLALIPQEVADMLNDIQLLLNNGLYQFNIITSTTGPTWVGRQGEQVLAVVGATTRLYVCTSDLSSTSWVLLVGT